MRHAPRQSALGLIAVHLALVCLFLFAFADQQTSAQDQQEPKRPFAQPGDAGNALGKPMSTRPDSVVEADTAEADDWPDRGNYQGWGRDTKGAVILLNAEELTQEQTSSGELTVIRDKVKFVQDSLTVWCDLARHRKQQGVLNLFGNVVMIDPDRELRAEEVTYFERHRLTRARKDVVILRDSVRMVCQRAEYDERTDIATFQTDMLLYDLKRDIQLTGAFGTYNTENMMGKVPRQPVLTSYDSTGTEQARIVSRNMEYDAQRGMALAEDSVRIHYEEVVGTCDLLYFYPDSSRALMIGNPHVIRNRDEAVGDTVWLYMTEDKLDSAVVIKEAVAYTPSDSSEGAPRSQLQGYRIVLDFEDGQVRRMQSEGQAVGIYHVFDEGEDQGSNRVSGDRVTLMMKEGALEDVIVVGGTRGQFMPPRLARELRKEVPDE